MKYSPKIREEELKNKVASDFFAKYDCTEIIKDIDFAVKAQGRALREAEYLLWAEAKSAPADVLAMLTQLILTIGKARTFNGLLPPKFLGCFDCEKIAFIPYADIQDIFHQNDFNWKAAPSNRESKEFKQVHSQVSKIINGGEPRKTYCFSFSDENSLKLFILKNFLLGKSDVSKINLLVPQDIRERKGSFFTPRIWVELSQKYIADVLGENWQDEYYVWDCAAGTGNLLAGLSNKYNIWASTLDKADVDVMHDRIDNGANLLKEHCFQFDFLNDAFDKLPEGLRKIINDPKKCKKLVIYINPPYAEAASARTIHGTGENKPAVAKPNKIAEKYRNSIGKAGNELFSLFLARIYNEMQRCKIANFATLKTLSASNFAGFREMFLARLEKLFVVPADTFDNVKGQFPIGFHIWDTSKKERFREIAADVYIRKDGKSEYLSAKDFFCYDNKKAFINDWYSQFYDNNGVEIGVMNTRGNDFQNQNYIRISSHNNHNHTNLITPNNLIPSCIYLAVRHCIEADWLNDRDQFLYPNDGWKSDYEFQSDCLAYALFNNNISCRHGVNHWIPFIEWDVGAHDKFDSNFMSDFIAGKEILYAAEPDLFYSAAGNSGNAGGGGTVRKKAKIKFSEAAKKVLRAGEELWKYYHLQPNCETNAGLYDIREFFQGRNAQSKMNSKSDDERYSELIGDLRAELKYLAKKIEPKVYEHGFLL